MVRKTARFGISLSLACRWFGAALYMARACACVCALALTAVVIPFRR